MTDPNVPFDASTEWRDHGPPNFVEAASLERVRRVHRHAAIERLATLALPLGALLLVAAALRHASNHTERWLGGLAAIGTAVAWISYLAFRTAERRALAASSPEFMSAVLRRRRGEQRLAVFVDITLAFELVFLVPWWVGGIGKHASELLSPIVILTLWTPAVAILLIGVWSARLWRTARRDIRAMQRMAAEFNDDEPADAVTRR
ncbi:MAG TPA: hypothetical protein VF785_23665 [Gemmatimonadaceae bacterium]